MQFPYLSVPNFAFAVADIGRRSDQAFVIPRPQHTFVIARPQAVAIHAVRAHGLLHCVRNDGAGTFALFVSPI